MYKISVLLIILIVIMPIIPSKSTVPSGEIQTTLVDYDPLVDVTISVDILAIRALDAIDSSSDPDFFLKILINNATFISPVWENTRYLYNCFSATADVPDDVAFVNVTIQLWDKNTDQDTLCDISKTPNGNHSGWDIHLQYDIRIGRWSGDNNYNDITGYGRVSGSADGSIDINENDAELWFEIHQNDYDNDTLPYWVETNIYGTDPTNDDTGSDTDSDGIPIEWEHRFGYNPLIWDNHRMMDTDQDSLNNIEEFQTYDFGSDPYNRNIIFHFDTGEVNGGEIIPYDLKTDFDELRAIWTTYFLHNNTGNWRRGVFHYLIFVHDQTPKGFAFSGDVSPYWGYIPGTDAFALANTLVAKRSQKMPLKTTDYIVASLIVHEMGHNFGIRFGQPFGCDNRLTNSPFKIGWFIWRNYKSIMNYRYTYTILDYSDGSHGKRDYDDWDHIDLGYFEIPE
jgi:hypothetical protein